MGQIWKQDISKGVAGGPTSSVTKNVIQLGNTTSDNVAPQIFSLDTSTLLIFTSSISVPSSSTLLTTLFYFVGQTSVGQGTADIITTRGTSTILNIYTNSSSWVINSSFETGLSGTLTYRVYGTSPNFGGAEVGPIFLSNQAIS